MIALLLVALALGLSNFAAAVGIGLSGVSRRDRWRIGIVFGAFEAAMPIIGLELGRALADSLGHVMHWVGAALLIATGAYTVWQAVQPSEPAAGGGEADTDGSGAGRSGATEAGADEARADEVRQPWGRLLLTGLALSVDNLAVGFSLGSYPVDLLTAATVIGAVSVVLTLAGLELGSRISGTAGQRGEALGGVILIGVGIAVAAGAL